MRFGELFTKRLRIRRLRPEDTETLAGYRGHSQVSKFQTAYSAQKAGELIEEMSRSDPSVKGKWFQFGIELRAQKRLIGDIGFLNSDENGKSWVGFTLDPRYWGHGYAAEAVQSVLSYYEQLGITQVWASTDPKNHSSIRLLKHLGFALVEEKPNDRVFVLQIGADRIREF